MITLIKKQHRKMILSAPIAFLVGSSAISANVNSIYPVASDISPTVGKTTTISVRFNSILPINATDGSLRVDPSAMRIESIDTSMSDLNLWSEKPQWSENDGTASWSGGIIDGPKHGAMNGEIIRAYVTPLKAGVTQVNIDPNSNLLQNDGNGTLLNATTSSITLVPHGLNNASPDIDKNGIIDIRDIAEFINELVGASTAKDDLNGDGMVDLKDLDQLIDLYQSLNSERGSQN